MSGVTSSLLTNGGAEITVGPSQGNLPILVQTSELPVQGGPSAPSVYTADQWAQRLITLLPTQWFSDEAKNPGGVLYALMRTYGATLASMQQGLLYAYDATYIQTAVGSALDSAAEDFYGSSLMRQPGQSDAAFAQVVQSGLFPAAGTYQALYNALKLYAGVAPSIVYPFDPDMTGAWGASYYDVPLNGNEPYSLRWAPAGSIAECYVETSLAGTSPLNGAALYTYDAGFMDTWTLFFADLSASQSSLGQLQQIIARVAPVGVAVWLKLRPV